MKLVELLAREKFDWQDTTLFYAQDGFRTCYPWASEPQFIDDRNEWGCGKIDSSLNAPAIHPMELADDHATAIVTRAQWEAERARIAKPEENKWIRHRGGECPVEAGVRVDVRYRDKDVGICLPAAENSDQHMRDAGVAFWRHDNSPNDIMAYRLHKPESSGSLHVTAPQTIPAHMILGYQSKEDMALATGCETMEEVEAHIPNAKTVEAMDKTDRGEGLTRFENADQMFTALDIEAKTDQIDGPIKWRDRVREIDSTVEALEEERLGLIQRLEDEGFKLVRVDAKVSPKETDADMSDWRNWKEGDVVEVVGSFVVDRIGALCTVFRVDDKDMDQPIGIEDEEDFYWPSLGDGDFESFKWHSRP